MIPTASLPRRGSAFPAGTAVTLAAGLGFAYLAVLGLAMRQQSFNDWGGMLLVPVCLAIGTPIVVRITRADAANVTSIALVGLAAKVLSAFVRYFVMRSAYDRAGDFERYHQAGVQIAAAQSGLLAPLRAWPTAQGTQFVEQFTGFVYTIIGPSRLGGFVVFSFIAYWGLFCFQRAVVTAAPAVDQVRYAKLVFLWPSLLFWPSSIGKDALVIFALGLGTLGAARMHVGRVTGLVLFGAGAWLAYSIRPHITLLLVAALAASFVVPAARARSRERGRLKLGPLPRVIGLIAMLVAVTFVLGKTADYFGIDTSEGGSTTDQILAITERRTETGGSAIASSRPNSPAEYPNAVVTVLFRPFLSEARSVPMLISALEATLLAGLTAVSLPRIGRALRAPQRTRLVVFALVFTAAFVFAFSSFSNLGLLARQRTQVLPFLFVLFAGQSRSIEARTSPAREWANA